MLCATRSACRTARRLARQRLRIRVRVATLRGLAGVLREECYRPGRGRLGPSGSGGEG